ncbi:carboxymuconolactone decarboxylase family protein [Halalkalibacterium halodurans]|jgi:AhpD family alkylhydroperoxidase|uniref:Alkylhydroperoxidase n=1 Tax=Halalkalibacterium halodurans TaxID=86665 RepID=A0A0M0KG88_ALKHA|nr:carboxymuconolactone decarboxylase family protein [Halalkalibacterium halodurans]MED3646669.1 carboxymuconolactone decarboxylase family protein [Halalkalibacterium halodurans]TES52402.1 carboxymuconolactone decarboxylase family protein [Halalkalibacterium halodurans]TPE66719.1 carboxymuconolactone decarboxylase family protein [Halalkalibacterium halodurans]
MDQQQMNPMEMALMDYKEGLGTFQQKMPEIAEKYNAFTEACFAKGELSQKQKQLIALGVSVFAQDEYCIIYHTKGCMDQDCSEEEILEAIGVTAAFGGGAAMSQAVTLVQEAMNEFGQNNGEQGQQDQQDSQNGQNQKQGQNQNMKH